MMNYQSSTMSMAINFSPIATIPCIKKENDVYSLDDFKHEQSLLVKSNQSYALFAGCS